VSVCSIGRKAKKEEPRGTGALSLAGGPVSLTDDY
jgi:hypothetical protein